MRKKKLRRLAHDFSRVAQIAAKACCEAVPERQSPLGSLCCLAQRYTKSVPALRKRSLENAGVRCQRLHHQPGMFCRVQRTMSLALMAPSWRATSRPLTNSASVGMLRIW